jgi:hypothetical protein
MTNVTVSALFGYAPTKGSPIPYMAQFVELVMRGPTQSKFARASMSALLVSRKGVPVTVRQAQLPMLIMYRTGVPAPKRARCWSFVLDGHTFYVLNLAEEGDFLFDTVTQQWCHWSTAGFDKQWNFQNGTMWGNRIVGADLLNDYVWEMDPSATLDNGFRDIEHIVTGGISTRSRTYIGCDSVRVSASFGLLDEVNGSVMNLRFSDDQEETWSDYFPVSLTEDDFDGEIAFRSLGSFMAPGRIFELSDTGGLIRIDGADAFLNGFDNDQQSQGEAQGE